MRSTIGWPVTLTLLLGCAVPAARQETGDRPETGQAAGEGQAAGPQEPGGVREPAFAGQYYPGEPGALKRAVEAYLGDALPPKPDRPIAIVVPHAGWVYSAQIAADAFRQAAGHRYDVVVLLGTGHTGFGRGRVAMHPGSAFQSPLGTVAIDRPVVAALETAGALFTSDAAAHNGEHSIEVQVPFVQHLFPGARIVPAVVGVVEPAALVRAGTALARALEGRRALIVASSDLSHYPPADQASAVDRRTLEAIASMSPDRLVRHSEAEMARGTEGLATVACGISPVIVAMTAAARMGATRGTALSYANSADIALGDVSRAVGYGAVVFSAGAEGPDVSAIAPARPLPPETPLATSDKEALLRLARRTLERFLDSDTLPLPRGFDPRATAPRGAFVTLKKRGELRGCIGRIEAGPPLPKLVSLMALEAGLNDPRFPKVTLKELAELEIEVSVLTPPTRISRPQEIRIGRDGIILRKGGSSAVFLPQVAPEQGWDLETTLDNLSLKAGLPPQGWKSGATFWVFQADVFGERDLARRR